MKWCPESRGRIEIVSKPCGLVLVLFNIPLPCYPPHTHNTCVVLIHGDQVKEN